MGRRICLALTVLLAITACGVTEQELGGDVRCTLRGCESQVSVTLPDLGLGGKAGVVKATMCFDDVCDTQRQTFERSGASFGRQGSDVEVSAFENDLVATLHLPGGNYDATTEHRVTLKVSVDGAKPVTLARAVRLNRTQPNGPECDPVCWQAAIKA